MTQRTRRLAWMLSICCAWLSLDLNAATTGPQANAEPLLTDEQAQNLIEDIKRIAADAEDALESSRSDREDRSVVLELTDYDPVRVFQWVQDETSWVPYRGVLRGAAGVLMDRRGNSLDRSLLLAALLEDAGFETRLARVLLSEETAAGILGQHSQATTSFNPADPGLEQSGESPIRETQRQVEQQAKALATLAGLREPMKTEDRLTVLIEETADHWWVQARLDSKWQDLDPMFPADSELTRGNQDVSQYPIDEIPDDLYHRLTLRIVLERWEGGVLVELTPLSHSFASADVPIFSHLEIRFVPFAEEWGQLDPETEALDELQMASSARFWRPILKSADRTVPGEWFSDSGQFEIPAFFGPATKLKSATKFLGGLGDSSEEKEPASQLTAAWLEYEVDRPGNVKTTVRREIFDSLGATRPQEGDSTPPTLNAEARLDRGLAFLGTTSTLMISSTPDPSTVDRRVLESWRRNRNFFIAWVYLAAGWEDERVPAALNQGGFEPIDLLAMAAVRDFWSRYHGLTFVDQINLFSSHLVYLPGAEGTSTVFSTDIVLNQVGVMPGTPADPRLVRLEQGVLDTLVETVFSGDEDSFNTYSYFAGRAEATPDWIAVDDASKIEKTLVGLPPNDLARIRSKIGDGNVVVVSPTSYTLADQRFASWWKIDPQTGTTLGMGYRGWGTEGTETGVTNTLMMHGGKKAVRKQGMTRFCKVADATLAVATTVIFTQADWDAADQRRRLLEKIRMARPGGPIPDPVPDLSEICRRKGKLWVP